MRKPKPGGTDFGIENDRLVVGRRRREVFVDGESFPSTFGTGAGLYWLCLGGRAAFPDV